MASIDNEIDRAISDMLDRVFSDYMAKPWWKRKIMEISWHLPRMFHVYL